MSEVKDSQTVSPPAVDDSRAIANLRVISIDRETVTFSLPGTDYRLQLACMNPSALRIGSRVRGLIHARALRMHRSNTGGKFIEPVYGTPRIVQGTIKSVDAPRRRVLIDLSVPMWVELLAGQEPATLSIGDMVNFYVESGTRFEPSDSAA